MQIDHPTKRLRELFEVPITLRNAEWGELFNLVAFAAPLKPRGDGLFTGSAAMRDRTMVLVRAEDADGITGWGEIWCNFPSVGA